MGKRHRMSLDSKLRRARMNGTGTTLHHFEVATVCEALRLLRACEAAERSERAQADQAAANQDSDQPTEGLERFLQSSVRYVENGKGVSLVPVDAAGRPADADDRPDLGGDVTIADGEYCPRCPLADALDCMAVDDCPRRDLAKAVAAAELARKPRNGLGDDI